MPGRSPSHLTIRSYQVGFGDCFLLTFRYSAKAGKKNERHVLIDCGSSTMRGDLDQVAAEITKDCGGKLTAVIATHRHADHINGFATAVNGKGPGDLLRALDPELVVQPWTENPETARDATAPAIRTRNNRQGLQANFVAGLEDMHAFAALALEESRRLGRALSAATRQQLQFLGEENLKNASAVKNLMTMGRKREYLCYGMRTGLTRLLPGVKVHVLGPPTPAQYPEIEKQRSVDNAEFWHILGASARRLKARGGIVPFAPRFRQGGARPAAVRWFIQRITAAHTEQRLEIVRMLDDAMNNTSLILLFEAGGKRFLFPGDAQIENWNFALKDAPNARANRTLLGETDFYKVGHHGSLNATPKTLWNLFKKKGGHSKAGRLWTAISTKANKHGKAARQTEVPRRTLVAALEAQSTYFSTQKLKKRESSRALLFDLD